MLQAMTTGHDGSLSTGHANSPRDMLRRLETMVLMTGYQMPLRAIREQIASAVDLIVHTARLKDGTRKITSITEVYGIEDDEILTQDIFAFKQTGVREDGKIEGALQPTGHRPTFMSQFARNGVELPPDEFGIPSEQDAKPIASRNIKARWGGSSSTDAPGQVGGGPGAGSRGRRGRHGLRVVDRADRPRDGPGHPGRRSRSTRASAWPTCRRSSRRPAARSTRSPGRLVAPRRVGLRRLQRGVGPLVPGRRAGRAGHADAAAPAPGRVPGLHRGHRRGRLIAPGRRPAQGSAGTITRV